MINEHPSNVVELCSDHAPKPDRNLVKDKSPEDFIASSLLMNCCLFVKRAFKSESGQLEHMWVKVTSVKDGVLVGLLNNDPVLDHDGLACDSEVTVELSQIEEILYDN